MNFNNPRFMAMQNTFNSSGAGWDSSGNSGTVSGSNSTLQILSDLYVGKDGSKNAFTVSDGARFEAGNEYRIRIVHELLVWRSNGSGCY